MRLVWKEAGLDARPVLLSTRQNGKIHAHEAPYAYNFNYMIVQIKSDEKKYFVDATQKNLKAGLLPFKCYNGKGWVVDENKVEWADFTKGVELKENITTMLSYEDGAFKGTMKATYQDHTKARVLDEIEETSKEEYINKKVTGDNIEVASFEMEGDKDPTKPLNITMKIEDKSAETAGDLIYLSPMVSKSFDENPFKNPKRFYPVDFGLEQSYTYMMVLNIPEGYKVDEMPQSSALILPNNKAKYSYSIVQSGQMIQVRCKMDINAVMFLPSEYEHLRSFVTQVIAKEEEQVVLKKIEKN